MDDWILSFVLFTCDISSYKTDLENFNN